MDCVVTAQAETVMSSMRRKSSAQAKSALKNSFGESGAGAKPEMIRFADEDESSKMLKLLET